MPTPRIRSVAIALAALMMLGGCSHKLVATSQPGIADEKVHVRSRIRHASASLMPLLWPLPMRHTAIRLE